MLTVDKDRGRDVFHDDKVVAHVAAVGLKKERLGVVAGFQPDTVVEDATISAIGGVPASNLCGASLYVTRSISTVSIISPPP